MKANIFLVIVFLMGLLCVEVVNGALDLNDVVVTAATFSILREKAKLIYRENEVPCEYYWSHPVMVATATKIAFSSQFSAQEKDFKRSQKHAISYAPDLVDAVVIFPLVDAAVGCGMMQANPKIAQAVFGQHKEFIIENGRLVISAAGTNILMNRDSHHNFLCKAAVQVGSSAVQTYIVQPMVKTVAKEGDPSYIVLEAGGNMLGMYAVASLVKMVAGSERR